MRIKNKKGFSLMEMLVVIAIIAVLAVVAIPVYTKTTEKAARAVDMANARAIKAMLSTMIISGEIQFPETAGQGEDGSKGVYVVVCRDSSSLPKGYNASMGIKIGDSVFCGANKGIVISGEESSGWNKSNGKLKEAVQGCFSGEMRSFSKFDSEIGGIGGWDWYIVEYYYDPDMDGSVRIFSGEKATDSDMKRNALGTTNIEKYMLKAAE